MLSEVARCLFILQNGVADSKACHSLALPSFNVWSIYAMKQMLIFANYVQYYSCRLSPFIIACRLFVVSFLLGSAPTRRPRCLVCLGTTVSERCTGYYANGEYNSRYHRLTPFLILYHPCNTGRTVPSSRFWRTSCGNSGRQVRRKYGPTFIWFAASMSWSCFVFKCMV